MTDGQLASLDFFDDEEFMAGIGKDSDYQLFSKPQYLHIFTHNHLSDIEVPEHLVPPDPDDGDSTC